jgi:hypothetical protein
MTMVLAFFRLLGSSEPVDLLILNSHSKAPLRAPLSGSMLRMVSRP